MTTYEVKHFAQGDECVKGMHELRDIGIPVPEVDIEQVDVSRPKFLQRRLDVEMEGFAVGASVEDLLLDRVLPVLGSTSILHSCRDWLRHRTKKVLTLEAMKSWSRIPFDSAHSPMI